VSDSTLKNIGLKKVLMLLDSTHIDALEMELNPKKRGTAVLEDYSTTKRAKHDSRLYENKQIAQIEQVY